MTTTKADELAAELEADGFSPKAHYGAAAELRRLSAVEAERDALRADTERWRFALTQPYEFWKRIGFMGCAEDQNEAIDAAMKGTT